MTRIFDPTVLDGKRILITGGGTYVWAAEWPPAWPPTEPTCISGAGAKQFWPMPPQRSRPHTQAPSPIRPSTFENSTRSPRRSTRYGNGTAL